MSDFQIRRARVAEIDTLVRLWMGMMAEHEGLDNVNQRYLSVRRLRSHRGLDDVICLGSQVQCDQNVAIVVHVRLPELVH